MKKLKYLLLLFIVMILFYLNAEGTITDGGGGGGLTRDAVVKTTGIGMCHGLEMNDGYCELETPATFSHPIQLGPSRQRLFYINPGDSSSRKTVLNFQYFMNPTNYVDPNDGLLTFCVDGNLKQPTNMHTGQIIAYPFARPYDVSTDVNVDPYEYIIGSLYTILMDEIKNKSGSVRSAVADNFQIINYAVRAINVRFTYDIPGLTINNEDVIPQLKNGQTQLSGLNNFNDNPFRLETGTEDYDLLQKWYCEALMSPKNLDHITGQEREHCIQILDGATPRKPINFQPVFDFETTQAPEYSGNTFSKTVKVKLSNLKPYKDNKYQLGTKPYFKITGVKCDMDVLDCRIKDTDVINLNQDILEKSNGDSFEFEVIVKGSTAQISAEINPVIELSYEYYHLFNTEVITELVHIKHSNPEHQRMIVIEPFPQERTEKIQIGFNQMCYTTVEGGQQEYWFGGRKVSLEDYISEHHCCNLNPDLPAGNPAKNNRTYQEMCQFEDEVLLLNKCDPNVGIENYEAGKSCLMKELVPKAEREMSHSYVHQYKLENIFNAPAQGIRKNFESFDVRDEKYNNNWDLPFTEEEAGIKNDNMYCRMFTSEDLDIRYPGVTLSANGGFFVFAPDVDGSYLQPMVEGKIQANYYINVKRWYKDYSEALNAEKDAYDRWKKSQAYEDALSELEKISPGPCTESGTCPVENPVDTYYTGSATARPRPDMFYDKFRRDLANQIVVEKRCGCGVNELPDPNRFGDPEENEFIYNKAKRKRERLYNQMKACQEGREVNWEYYLAPDLKFYYSHDEADINGDVRLKPEEIPMKIAWKEDVDGKYWTKYSILPEEDRYAHDFTLEKQDDFETYMTQKLNEVQSNGPRTESKIGREVIKYGAKEKSGGSTWFLEDEQTYPETAEEVDKLYNFYQKLYYKPEIYRYTLTASGQVPSQSFFVGYNLIDLGYVFNVNIETRAGAYDTWFEMRNAGHIKRKPNHSLFRRYDSKPNTQNSIDVYVEENDFKNREDSVNKQFDHLCELCVINPLVKVECKVECEDQPRLYFPYFFYRTVSLHNITPHPDKRKTSNWETVKGQATKNRIKQIEEAGGIYDDRSDYLEYSFVLTPEIMMENRKINRETDYKAYTSYALSCENGKECKSPFVTAAAQASEKYIPGAVERLNTTRLRRWKYFIQGEWKVGSISSMIEAGYFDEDEGYPDELNPNFIESRA